MQVQWYQAQVFFIVMMDALGSSRLQQAEIQELALEKQTGVSRSNLHLVTIRSSHLGKFQVCLGHMLNADISRFYIQ